MATPFIDPQIIRQKEIPNRLFRTFLLSLESVIGSEKMATVLRNAGLPQYIGNYPPENDQIGACKIGFYSRIDKAVLDLYGSRAGRSILDATGRAQARQATQAYGAVTNIVRLALGILPVKTKVGIIIDTITRVSNEQTGFTNTLKQEGNTWFYDVPACSHCLDTPDDSTPCINNISTLLELVDFFIPNVKLEMEEIECKAKGATTCRFRIMLPGEKTSQPVKPI